MIKTKKNNSLIVVSFLIGCLAAASFERENLSILYVFSLVYLGLLIDEVQSNKIFVVAYSFGLGFFLTATWWLGLLKGYWYLPILLASYEALFWGIPAHLTAKLFSSKDRFRFFALFSGIYVFEVLRSTGRFGFPWMNAGYYLSGTDLRKVLYLFGIQGAGFLLLLLAASIATFIKSNEKLLGLFVACIVFLMFGLSSFAPVGEKFGFVRVTVLEDSLLPEEKHEEDPLLRVQLMLEHFQKMIDHLPQETSLAVFPETSFPYAFPFNKNWSNFLQDVAQEKGAVLLVGAETVEMGKFFNSIVVYDSDGYEGRYDKKHLVPFGEYIPFRKKLQVFPIVRNTTDFSPGKRSNVVQVDNYMLGLGICWESALPFYGAEAAKKKANLLVFSTNDNWFLFSNQSRAHWRHTKAQSDSSGLAVVQSANAGITGFYFNGIEKTLPTWTIGALTVKVPLLKPHQGVLRFQNFFYAFSIVASLLFFTLKIIKSS